MRRALLVLALCLAAGAAGAQTSKVKGGKPAWAELTVEQQHTLAPLKADWESLDPDRRRKWIGIAKRYPGMKPQEQERVQRRMQAWAKLTPEQWAEYQALPPSERQNLAPPQTPARKKK